MANGDRPQGFWPKGKVISAEKHVAGATIRAGEFVSLSADGKMDPVAAGAVIAGLALNNAADGEDILVSVAPNQRYVGQVAAAEFDVQADVGQLCDIVATADNTTYEAARMEIDGSSLGTGSGGQLVLLGREERPDNALGEFVDAVVKINEYQAYGEDDFAGI